MNELYLVPLVFFVAYFIESIFGFGGLIISFTILSFFVDTKNMIFLGLYVATCASTFVVISDRKSFSKEAFSKIFVIAFIGTIIGLVLFNYFTSLILLKIFAVFLLFFSIKSLFYESLSLKSKILQKLFLFAGGILQGLFGTGGPFTVLAAKDWFKSKSQLRTTMAVFFIVFNIIRAIQLTTFGTFNYSIIQMYWWVIFPLALAIFLGYRIHLKINEAYFKIGINWLLLFAGIVLLFK